MITLMKETEGRILLLKASECLTKHDYETVLIPQVTQRVEKFGKIRLLFYLAEDFAGWEFGAAWDDAVFGVQHRHDFEKIAVVGDQKWLEWATKIGAYFMDGQSASYSLSEFQQAVAWIKK